MTKLELLKALTVVLFLGMLGVTSLLLLGIEPRGFSSPLFVFVFSAVAVPATVFVRCVSRQTLLRVGLIFLSVDFLIAATLLWEYFYGPNNYYIPRYWDDYLLPLLVLWLIQLVGWQIGTVVRWARRVA